MKIKLTENQLRRVINESVKKIIREYEDDVLDDTEDNADYDTDYAEDNEEDDYPSYDEWSKYLNGKEPVFEFYNKKTDDYDNIYVDYNPMKGILETGSVSNLGFSPDGDIKIRVEDGNFQSALEQLYEELTDKGAMEEFYAF